MLYNLSLSLSLSLSLEPGVFLCAWKLWTPRNYTATMTMTIPITITITITTSIIIIIIMIITITITITPPGMHGPQLLASAAGAWRSADKQG